MSFIPQNFFKVDNSDLLSNFNIDLIQGITKYPKAPAKFMQPKGPAQRCQTLPVVGHSANLFRLFVDNFQEELGVDSKAAVNMLY